MSTRTIRLHIDDADPDSVGCAYIDLSTVADRRGLVRHSRVAVTVGPMPLVQGKFPQAHAVFDYDQHGTLVGIELLDASVLPKI